MLETKNSSQSETRTSATPANSPKPSQQASPFLLAMNFSSKLYFLRISSFEVFLVHSVRETNIYIQMAGWGGGREGGRAKDVCAGAGLSELFCKDCKCFVPCRLQGPLQLLNSAVTV